MNKKKGIALALLPLLLLPAAYIFIGFYRSILSKSIMPCPLNFFFGIYCPGCGGTHCIYALADGHVIRALRNNAIVFFSIIALILVWIQEMLRSFGRNVKLLPDSTSFWWSAAGAAAVYSVLRNMVPLLAPA